MFPIFSFTNNILFGVLEGVAGVLRGLLGLAGIALYILRSIGLYRMCRNTGMPRPWFSWAPFLHEYQCAKLGDRGRVSAGRPAFLERWIVVAAALYVLLGIFSPIFAHIFLIGWLYRAVLWCAGVIVLALAVISDYWVYRDFEPNLSALFTVLSVFRLDGIAKFLIRENVPVGVAGACDPKQPRYTQPGSL